ISRFERRKQPQITIVNIANVRPIGLSINASSVRIGGDGDVFYSLPNDMMRTYHDTPQVEVLVNGLAAYCSNIDNNCQFQVSIAQTPMISSIVQNQVNLVIQGVGFSSSMKGNQVLIGEQGSCNIIDANSTYIRCEINHALSGSQIVRVNVIDKGFASSNTTIMVTVPLAIHSFDPPAGGIGGGYSILIHGRGFSSHTIITVDGKLCINSQWLNFSSIRCTVPPSTSHSAGQVILSAVDGQMSVNALARFTYNSTNQPFVTSIQPSVVTMDAGTVNITGSGFGNQSFSVYVGSKSATIVSSSMNLIRINLPQLPPGLYPIIINTSTGLVQSPIPIEYRFYFQRISPVLGSLYGGGDIYIDGVDFIDSTTVQFRSENNRLLPCNIISLQSNQIHCQTPSFVQQVTITADGVHPLYGLGFAWSPRQVTVQQGAVVTWKWDSSLSLSTRKYRVQQLFNAYGTDPVVDGFDSGSATISGSFSYQFNSVGTYHYWSPSITSNENIIIRGVVNVIPSKSEVWTVEVVSNEHNGNICYSYCQPINLILIPSSNMCFSIYIQFDQLYELYFGK
ncbi:unnamed protein product, partial [Adineta ricciae]